MADRGSARDREAARVERERERERTQRPGATAPGDTFAVAEDEPEEHEDEPEEHEDEPEEHEDEPERPSGTRRVSPSERPVAVRARAPRPVRAQRVPRQRSRRRLWVRRVASLAALALGVAATWFLVALFQPFHGSPRGRITVEIPPGSSSGEIAELLARNGVISSSFFFKLRATLAGERSELRSGTYHLQLGMTYGAVLPLLTEAPPAAKVTELTITEGRTRQQVAELLHAQHIRGNYLSATRSSPLLDPSRYGLRHRLSSLEGFLFPDTFKLVDPVKVSALVDDQLVDFKRRIAQVGLGYAAGRHLSAYDVLKIASLVEAEAASASSRPLVASVIYNRLADGMMLQLDSTTRYATGNFTSPLTVSQLGSSSPYNTHTHFGLPPTPIDNPGLSAIQAAAHPAASRYLFFFAKPCSTATVFATSYAQFLHLLAVDRRPHC